MRNTIEHKHLRRLHEADFLVELTSVFLRFDIDQGSTQMLLCSGDGSQHDLATIAFATLSSDDTANGDLVHVCSFRTDTRQGYRLIIDREPEMDGRLVVAIEILIGTVLLHDKDISTNTQQFVEFVDGQLLEGFLMKDKGQRVHCK